MQARYTILMFEAEYMVFCDSKAIDDKGRISLINIFDTIYANDFPAAHPQLKVVTKLTANKKAILNKDVALKLAVYLKTKEVAKLEGDMHVTIEKGNSLIQDFELNQFVFPETGDYAIRLEIDNQLVVERLLKLRNVKDLSEA